jgi:hypothetical protein
MASSAISTDIDQKRRERKMVAIKTPYFRISAVEPLLIWVLLSVLFCFPVSEEVNGSESRFKIFFAIPISQSENAIWATRQARL